MFKFADFESINVGDIKSLEKTITIDDVKKFVDITGDDNPLHVNQEFAGNTSFKEIVVHGMLGASYISTIIGTKLPGPGALWVSQSFNFLKPVRLGDKLIISCKVTKKYESERLLQLEASIVNQNQELILSGEGRVKLLSPIATEIKSEAKEKSIPKVALVTGGSGGIGSAICEKLVSNGWFVAFNYRGNSDRAERLLARLQEIRPNSAIAIQGDVSDSIECENIIKRIGQIFSPPTALIFNASPSILSKTLDNLNWDDISYQMDVQLKSAINLTKHSINYMKELKYGRIVSITSQAIDGQPSVGWTAYAIAKSALETFTHYMSAELGPHGITSNAVSPGMCQTGLIGSVPEKTQLLVARQTPLRRLALPNDIGNAVNFLLSENADFINGQVLPVNGGIVSR